MIRNIYKVPVGFKVQVAVKVCRIQTKEDGQHTPDDPDVDLLAAVHHAVVALGEQVDSYGVHCEVYQPLVL